MNENQDKCLNSVHFINGDNDQSLRCEFTMPHHQSASPSSKTSDEPDGRKGDDLQNNQKKINNKSNKNSKLKLNQPMNSNQPYAHDVVESSFLSSISRNDKIETQNEPTTSVPSNSSIVCSQNNENDEKYDFATSLPYSDYKLPPKRSEFSSFMHNPLIKTLDTFGKLSGLLKEDVDEHSDIFFASTPLQNQGLNNGNNEILVNQRFPPPSLPQIEAKNSKSRLPPVTEFEYDTELKFQSKICIFERIFLGGLESDNLRRRLWPILLGVMDNENEENWVPLTELYNLYMNQWKSIKPDQESRFTSFKEKKSMCERDVVRCDRCHPYFQKEENINILKDILMCYIMYDFDTGYVQGMTDLAAPLLFIFEGDPVKSFWCFTGVLNLTKKNFEMDQKTVKNLLIKLFKLVNMTDPCFAEFLADNESGNCYFAFRWLICLFKREFVKADNSYDQLLLVWDTLWAVSAYVEAKKANAQEEFEKELNILKEDSNSSNVNSDTSDLTNSFSNKLDLDATFGTSPPYIIQSFENRVDFDNLNNRFYDVNNFSRNKESDLEQDEINQLSTFELFFLSISLAIIRQERDLIFTQKLDSSEIIKHFNSLNLKDNLTETLKHATVIWYWLKYDGGEDQLHNEKIDCKDINYKVEGFDLLND